MMYLSAMYLVFVLVFVFLIVGAVVLALLRWILQTNERLLLMQQDHELQELHLLAFRRMIYHLQRIEYLQRGGELHDEAILDDVYPEE